MMSPGKNCFYSTNIKEYLDTLADYHLSTIDPQKGYHQIDVDQADKRKTAFITRYGYFEFIRMTFGLDGVPGTFRRALKCVIKGLQWNMLLIYLDDVIFASHNIPEHLKEDLGRVT